MKAFTIMLCLLMLSPMSAFAQIMKKVKATCYTLHQLKFTLKEIRSNKVTIVDSEGKIYIFPKIRIALKSNATPYDGKWYICTSVKKGNISTVQYYLLKPRESI